MWTTTTPAWARQFARIRDFTILHYRLTARRDSEPWRAMATMVLPDTLAFRLHAWRLADMPREEALQRLRQRRKRITAVVAAMPTHEACLRRMVTH